MKILNQKQKKKKKIATCSESLIFKTAQRSIQKVTIRENSKDTHSSYILNTKIKGSLEKRKE